MTKLRFALHSFSTGLIFLEEKKCESTELDANVSYLDFFLNPAYGRHQIAQPMWIVALIPKKGGPRIHKNHKKIKD